MINIKALNVTRGKQRASKGQAKGKQRASKGQAKGNNLRI